MNTADREKAAASIDATLQLFRNTPNVFLTEDDLRMHLCNHLLQHFGSLETTEDGDKSISLHSEVRWYGDGTLNTRSDIVLVDVTNLEVLRHNKLPSKGYGFNIPKGIIELKFRRPNSVSNTKFARSIRKDIAKLEKLTRIFYGAKGQEHTAYWLIVFDKKERLTETIQVPKGIEYVYEFQSSSTRRHKAGY